MSWQLQSLPRRGWNAWQSYRRHRQERRWRRELRAFRHEWDDLLLPAEIATLDGWLAAGQNDSDLAATVEMRESQFEAMRRRLIPHPGLRELCDVLAVALMVAFGIRALFVQPFKIPTSSMQPTLYGIHFIDREKSGQAAGVLPGFGKLGALGNYLAFAARRAEATVEPGGYLRTNIREESRYGILTDTLLPVGEQTYRLPGSMNKVAEYTNLTAGSWTEGLLCDGYWSDGDHLFVNRLSLYLIPPRRGDVMVFLTEGITGPGGERPSDSGAYYIKRLVGLPGDTLKIVDDELWVKVSGATDFVPITALDSRFAKLYSGQGGYQGHVNRIPGISHFLRRGYEEFKIPEDEFFLLGDNSLFSADSRVWGTVPRRNLIGRASVVFWPFSRRWGRVDHAPALAVPTGTPGRRTFESMNLQ